MDYSFKNFQKTAIVRLLALDKYNYIIENLYKCDVSVDSDFQKAFNSFYRVRRDEEWRNIFYTYFESIKKKRKITFEEIVCYMYKKTGKIEASFSSKLLSTINPDMPIWDQFVLSNLKLKVRGSTQESKLKDTIEVYNKIVEIVNIKLKEKDIQQSIKEFKKYFPEYNISDIKIFDYLLWNSRD